MNRSHCYKVDAARDYNWNFLGDLGVKRVVADVRDLDRLLDEASGCDYLIHTAAQPAVTISMEDPILDASTNVLGTLNVLETARRHSIPVASCATIHVYGNWINSTLSETETRYVRTRASVDESAPTMLGYLTPLHASKRQPSITCASMPTPTMLERQAIDSQGSKGHVSRRRRPRMVCQFPIRSVWDGRS